MQGFLGQVCLSGWMFVRKDSEQNEVQWLQNQDPTGLSQREHSLLSYFFHFCITKVNTSQILKEKHCNFNCLWILGVTIVLYFNKN